MRRWPSPAVLFVSLTFAATGHALAPGDTERGFREGSNHHLGDDGFAALYGRLPGPGDGEALRMHAHFVHARAWLASREATRPELASRRGELLGYLGEYIARGTTPQNAHVPWRTPVFIDDKGTICAVGYLIERSHSRELAEKVAREHRYSVLEDIAAAMPDVRAWVESSGFTLEELASVQPGYTPPVTWDARDLDADPSDNGDLTLDVSTDKGVWRSAYPSGERLAEGPYVGKRAHGKWRFFHKSGNFAAEGHFDGGRRDGAWRFFYDADKPVTMAAGSFMQGALIEEWRHFDRAGKLVARSRPESPWPFRGAGYLVALTPRPGKIQQWSHRGNVAGTRHRLDYLADGTEQLYVHDQEDIYYDAGGHKLERNEAGAWNASDCHWSRVRKASARSGDVVTLHGLTLGHTETCGAPQLVPAVRAAHLDAIRQAAREGTHTQAPASLVDVVAANMAAVGARPRLDAGPGSADPAALASR